MDTGYFFAGLQYQNQCICMDQHPGRSAKTEESACDYNCPGDYRSACGGYYMINFYEVVA